MRYTVAAIFLWLVLCASTRAEVVSSGTAGFQTRLEADVAVSAAEAFAAFTRIGEWWSSEHTFSGDAKNISMDVTPGGAWREALPNGGFVEHMRVIEVSPGATLVLSGGLGPMHFMAVTGTMTVSFEPKDGGTHVTLDFAAGGYDPDGFAKLPAAVDGVLGEQFARYIAYANK